MFDEKGESPKEEAHYVLTIKDIEDLSFDDMILQDKRTFQQYFFDCLALDHIVMKAFFYKSLLSPQFTRIINLFTSLTLLFALNAMFLTDSYTTINSTGVKSFFT
jgi:hypothetical protein